MGITLKMMAACRCRYNDEQLPEKPPRKKEGTDPIHFYGEEKDVSHHKKEVF